ncbi:hypothetical protein J6590_011535 [Homalodisca vitripennis]|nr:hypothetical protein J6590_011535 [Homalodisca vitripennis]
MPKMTNRSLTTAGQSKSVFTTVPLSSFHNLQSELSLKTLALRRFFLRSLHPVVRLEIDLRKEKRSDVILRESDCRTSLLILNHVNVASPYHVFVLKPPRTKYRSFSPPKTAHMIMDPTTVQIASSAKEKKGLNIPNTYNTKNCDITRQLCVVFNIQQSSGSTWRSGEQFEARPPAQPSDVWREGDTAVSSRTCRPRTSPSQGVLSVG